MLTYASMFGFFGRFFVKPEPKLDARRMRMREVNSYAASYAREYLVHGKSAIAGENKSNRLHNQTIQPKTLRKEIFQGADIKGKNSSPRIADGKQLPQPPAGQSGDGRAESPLEAEMTFFPALFNSRSSDGMERVGYPS